MITMKVSKQSSLPENLQETTPFNEVRNSLHGPNNSTIDEMVLQESSGSVPSTVKIDSKLQRKNKICKSQSSRSAKTKNKILNDPAFSTSYAMPPSHKPPLKPDLHRDNF